MITIRNAHRFRSRTYAFTFCYERCTTPMRVVHGDDDMFWVVTPADAERLLRSGYEMAA